MTFKSLNLSGLITIVVFRARHETTFPIMLPTATVAAHWVIEKRAAAFSCSAVRSSGLNNDCARGWCETGEMRDLTPMLYIALFHTFFSKQTQWICGFLQNTRNTESVSLLFNSSRDSERLLLLNQYTTLHTLFVCFCLMWNLRALLTSFIYTCLVKKQVFRYFLWVTEFICCLTQCVVVEWKWTHLIIQSCPVYCISSARFNVLTIYSSI